jgi:hypothetical protein
MTTGRQPIHHRKNQPPEKIIGKKSSTSKITHQLLWT